MIRGLKQKLIYLYRSKTYLTLYIMFKKDTQKITTCVTYLFRFNLTYRVS